MLSSMGVTSRKKMEWSSYQLGEVSQVWFIHLKDNRPVESGPIEWEAFNRYF